MTTGRERAHKKEGCVRGPFDDTQDNQGSLTEGGAASAETARPRRKPPGGKALLRLLELLESRGLTEAADATVAVAVPEEQKADYAPGSPLRMAPAAEAGGGAASLDEGGGEPGTMSAPATASAYMAAAEGGGQASGSSGPLTGPPTATGPQWRSLGPWTIPNGQTYGSSRVNVSGRVSSIAVDPSNAAHVLCGAAGGGVWESFDRGASWSPRTDFAATLTTGAIAFDRRAPATVYCGTGEGNFYWPFGVGILRSTNGGTTWSTLCTAPFVGQGFYDLLVDPANSSHLVAGTTGGLYISNNGGVTWTRQRAALTWSVSMAPAGGAAAEVLAGCSDGVFRSTDSGVTWAAVALPGGPGAFDRVAVSIAPSNPGVAYVWGARGATVYLYRRSGGTWTAQPLPPGSSTSQAWYDWYLAASPDRDNQVYCAGIESYRGDLSGTTWTWRTISNKGASGDSIHPDQHAIAFESGNPNTIYVGCDGGLFRSPDRGITWVSCNNGLVISEFEDLAQNFGLARWVIGGTQDNGTERWTGSPTWTHVADGDGGDCAVNRTTPTTVFHTYYNMSPERSVTGGDFGSWSYLPPPVPAGEGSAFYPPFEASANGGDTVAIGGDALYISRNNMTNWTRVAFPTAARSGAMFIPNINTVLVGVQDGRIFRTTWNGVAWTALTALTTPRAGAVVSDLLVDAANANRIWAVYSTRPPGGRVFRSDNAGASWTDVSAGLPALPGNAIEVDPWNSNRVWVAMDLGVYQSLNAGASWADFSASLPNAIIGDIVFHPHARVLRAGTRNRGVWEIPVDGWMVNPICGVQWVGTLNPNETKRWFTFNWPATWHIVWTVMPTTIKSGAPEITWSVQVERASAEFVTYWITVQNLTNIAVAFEGRYCILSRY
jgi:hypothetical protein